MAVHTLSGKLDSVKDCNRRKQTMRLSFADRAFVVEFFICKEENAAETGDN